MKPLARAGAGLAAVCLLVLTACGSAAPAAHHTAAAAATRAPATSVISSPALQTDPNGQQCSSLDSLGYCPGDDPSPTPAAPDTAACGTLTIMGSEVQNLTYTATPNAPPACADPRDLWGGDSLTSGTFLGDASNASNDTSGTSQANSDVQAVLGDFNSLNAELAQTSGAEAQGCTAANQCSP